MEATVKGAVIFVEFFWDIFFPWAPFGFCRRPLAVVHHRGRGGGHLVPTNKDSEGLKDF